MKTQKWLVFSSIVLVLVGLGGYWFVHEQKALSQEQTSLKQQKQAFNEQQSDQKQVISELRSSIQKLEKERSYVT